MGQAKDGTPIYGPPLSPVRGKRQASPLLVLAPVILATLALGFAVGRSSADPEVDLPRVLAQRAEGGLTAHPNCKAFSATVQAISHPITTNDANAMAAVMLSQGFMAPEVYSIDIGGQSYAVLVGLANCGGL